MSRLLLALILTTWSLGFVVGKSDLPSYPELPTSLLEMTAKELSPIDIAEPAAASALVEVDSASELPPSEIALAAVFPSAASNPLTAALAIEVPNPNTFLKDDVFLQQLEHEHVQAEQAEALENGASTESEGYFDDLISDRPLQPPPRRNRNGERPSAQRSNKKSKDDTASLTDLYNNRPHAGKPGRFLSKQGGVMQGHGRGPAAKRFPEADQAPHQEHIPRTFRSSRGHFEKNLAFRQTHSAKDAPFPHHGGHTAAPHNKGRKNAKVNLPKKPLSRHILAQKKGSKTNRFPKAKSQRAERAAARRAAAKKRADRLAGKRVKKTKAKARKGKGLNAHKAKKGKKALKGKKGKATKSTKGKATKAKAAKGKKTAAKGKAGKANAKKGGKAAKGGKAPKAASKAGKKGDKSILGRIGKALNAGVSKLATKAHKGINDSVERAKNALKNRFGGFFTMAELKAELAAQRGPGGGKKQKAPESAFGDGFEHVQEQRADMRADVQRFKDVEFAATKAAADLEKLTAEHAKREAILQHHIDAKFKAHSNLHTMFGASNGVFDRLPTHPSQGRIRGSPARRSYTPARRIVPARLARLEDLRMQERRRTYARGMMADRYHQQLHGENLGVFAGPGEYTQPDAFLQMGEDGAVHDRAPSMRAPPQ